MAALRWVTRAFGWLMTPIVAWAASFLGAWLAALLTSRTTPLSLRLALLALTAVAFGVGATRFWLRLLRRSPHLQEALAVHSDGTRIVEEPLDDTATVDAGEVDPA